MIEIENVSKRFDSLNAINDITFTIQSGEIFGIVGESGAGKSTLLRCLQNLETPESGNIMIDKKNIKDKNALKDTSTVFQNYNLLNNLRALDNVHLPLKLRGQKSKEAALEMLRYVNLEDKANHYPSQLSGGEMQRLAIARALVSKPKYLLCDEPSSALDLKSRHDLILLLKRINNEFKTTIILVTHELDLAKALCSKVAVLNKGNLEAIIDVNQSETLTNKPYIDLVREVLE